MKFLFKVLFLVMLLAFVWNLFGNNLKDTANKSAFEQFKTKILTIIEHPSVAATIDTIQLGMETVLEDIHNVIKGMQQEEQPIEEVAKTKLEHPLTHTFSVHNIEIGNSKEYVERLVGIAQRSTLNEYGVDWYTYHDHYQNFFMAAYDEQNKVAGLYTNQDLISSKQGIARGSSKESVLAALGEPMSGIRKGLVTYRTQNDGEYDLFQMDHSYITIFYDKHENNTVTAIQIISSSLEEQKDSFYPEASTALKEGFEWQLFDLTNAARVVHGLPFLTWDEQVQETARDHSSDMAKNHYFDHTNLEGKSPFDRMEEDHINFRAAGENLAAGQTSSIFAHEGLMNSLGHRENNLHSDFESLGVGVAFDSESKPYFTENFLTR
ncbi:CAP domain-containing protein [Bacillus benzoevorans]|uniref:Uncharacterized protein YkwD n=1 Tax=Bacillus benzoevorans TaxID=1456 RepID=A0A7X0HNV7_9BACI|nr:CAP domain-containing protein [Bacillus benzoevorans]MBB6444240.1 uncharacterized protein YkwD [Bacillus benzoevorans]